MKATVALVRAVVILTTVVVVVGAGVWLWNSVQVEDPFSLDQSYRIETAGDGPPGESMILSNESDTKLRVFFYNTDDPGRLVARTDVVMPPGGSATVPRHPSLLSVWRSQFVDEKLFDTPEVWSDVKFTGSGSRVDYEGTARPPVSITNDVDEALKVCTYLADDTVRVKELKCLDFSGKGTQEWSDGPRKFTVRVYRHATLDKPLASLTGVNEAASVTITKPTASLWPVAIAAGAALVGLVVLIVVFLRSRRTRTATRGVSRKPISARRAAKR